MAVRCRDLGWVVVIEVRVVQCFVGLILTEVPECILELVLRAGLVRIVRFIDIGFNAKRPQYVFDSKLARKSQRGKGVLLVFGQLSFRATGVACVVIIGRVVHAAKFD
jgi:hypothetical protein